MVCFRYIIVNTLHTGENKGGGGGDDDDDDDDNNGAFCCYHFTLIVN